MTDLRIFIGWDRAEPVAFAVLVHSLLRRASRPLAITPLTRQSLGRVYTRERHPNEATDFSLTRFLVPFLSGYEGLSIFMDCDMLCRVDIGDVLLPVLADPGRAVYCCQHDYVPKQRLKFDGHAQTAYPRKNWSSFMVFDNQRCRALTPGYVNTATGLELHRFHWLEDATALEARGETCRCGHERTQHEATGLEHQARPCTACPCFHFVARPAPTNPIGALPLTWNHLVGEYPPSDDAHLLHFTNGTPCFADYADCDHAAEWWAEYRDMLRPAHATEAAWRAQRGAVHAAPPSLEAMVMRAGGGCP